MTYDIPSKWKRLGLVLARDKGAGICSVAGDPCIVWDEEVQGWRMLLFFSLPGHAHAICWNKEDIGPGRWEMVGPLAFTNPGDLAGSATHKPFVSMDARQPNMGCPSTPQDGMLSHYGSAQAVAVQASGESRVRKLGIVLASSQQAGHWASGWVGGLQLLPGARHRWIAVVNASPTAAGTAFRFHFFTTELIISEALESLSQSFSEQIALMKQKEITA